MTFELLSSGGFEGKIEPHRVTCKPGLRAERDTHPGNGEREAEVMAMAVGTKTASSTSVVATTGPVTSAPL